MDMSEIDAKGDGLFIFVSIVGIMLFMALLMKAAERHKEKDSEGMLTALFFAFLALLIAIMTNFAVQDPSRRLIKFTLDFNSNEFKEAIFSFFWTYDFVRHSKNNWS